MPLVQWIMQNLQIGVSALLIVDSKITANGTVTGVPATKTYDNDRYSLGVTFGIPELTKRGERKNIKIKFMFAENTYDYEKELGKPIVVFLKGIGPKKAKYSHPPSITLETIKAGNGQNYNLQE